MVKFSFDEGVLSDGAYLRVIFLKIMFFLFSIVILSMYSVPYKTRSSGGAVGGVRWGAVKIFVQ